MAGMPGIIVKVAADTRDAIQGLGQVNRALGKTQSTSQKASRAISAGWKAAGIGVAAAGAAFVAVAADAIQAAIEEEKSITVLHKTMENLGLAAATTGVDKFVDDLQFAANVADNKIRPAFDRLIRSTGDVAEAQRATRLTLNIAAAQGLEAVDVANVLGKAYDGNTNALGRMGLGIDKAILKTGDMAAITVELTRLFGGQSAAGADTLGGAIAGVQIAVDELSESFGKGLVGATGDSVAALQEQEAQLRRMQPAAENAGGAVSTIITSLVTMYDRTQAFSSLIDRQQWRSAFDVVLAGIQGDDAAMGDLINSTRDGVAEADNLARSAWSAADAYSAAAQAAASVVTASKGIAQWSAADAYTPAELAKRMDWYARRRKARRDAEALKAKQEAAAAAAKAKAAASSRSQVTSRGGSDTIDVSYLENAWSPLQYNINRKMAERRADGRGAQRDARTGGRP